MTDATRARNPGHRLTEMLAVLLLGVATVGTAWCGYQSSEWNSEQQQLGRRASDERVESNRQFGLALQTIQYDANIIAQYGQAVVDDDTDLQAFFRESLIRPDFRPVLERWEQEVAQGRAPANLLTDRDYLDQQLAGFEQAQERAAATDIESQEAGDNGDDYVVLTLLLAMALFFAGVTTSFQVAGVRLVLLALSSVAIAYAVSKIASLPVA
jgi:hypothetical protein